MNLLNDDQKVRKRNYYAEGLEIGRNARREQLKLFRDNIPSIAELIEGNCINLEKWFEFYRRLIDFGCRQIKSINVCEDNLEVIYTNYSNGKKKLFATLLPRKIRLDEDFQYFLGLWIGDRSGGGRMGIMNKNKEINMFTCNYLKKLHQKCEFVIHVHSDEIPGLDYHIDKVVRINSKRNGYAVSVHAINSILKSFFEYISSNLDLLLDLIPNKNIFFAGLFDAEGNVFLEDGCFRWSSKNKENIRIFTEHLKGLNLFHRFDGSNLVTNNKYQFSKIILPHLKHPNKINDANLVCFKRGNLNSRFKGILRFILENPGKTNKEISKALKRVKLYSQIRFLEINGFVHNKDYPMKIYITDKGVASLSHGGKDL